MKQPEGKLERLFELARARPSDESEPMPPYLKTRVLAHWRSALVRDPMARSLAVMCRVALACATIVMIGSVAWSYDELMQDQENEVAIANYELRTEVTP